MSTHHLFNGIKNKTFCDNSFCKSRLIQSLGQHWTWADCIERRCKSGARPAQEDKSFLLSLLSMSTSLITQTNKKRNLFTGSFFIEHNK
jgi:hypothetical protein